MLSPGVTANYQKLFRDAVLLFNQNCSSAEPEEPDPELPLGKAEDYEALLKAGLIHEDEKTGD